MRWMLSLLTFASLSAVEITQAQINAIGFDALTDDRSVEAPFAMTLATTRDDYQTALATADFRALLDQWPAATQADHRLRVDALLSVLALADLGRKAYESQAPLLIQQQLQATLTSAELQQLLGMAILHPQQINLLTEIPALQLTAFDATVVRQRVVVYATKLLGRVRGYLPKQMR